jgi:hypothetical protein
VRLAACQPRVAAFFNFLLVDEDRLGGWQSGLLWADWKRKPAFAYRTAIEQPRGGLPHAVDVVVQCVAQFESAGGQRYDSGFGSMLRVARAVRASARG